MDLMGYLLNTTTDEDLRTQIRYITTNIICRQVQVIKSLSLCSAAMNNLVEMKMLPAHMDLTPEVLHGVTYVYQDFWAVTNDEMV